MRCGGSVLLGGAGLLVALSSRLRRDTAEVTESHPKVCHYACTRQVHDWATASAQMTAWIDQELGVPTGLADRADDDEFDACVAALAALRGWQGAWTNDLHKLPWLTDEPVRYVGPTNYWWPE